MYNGSSIYLSNVLPTLNESGLYNEDVAAPLWSFALQKLFHLPSYIVPSAALLPTVFDVGLLPGSTVPEASALECTIIVLSCVLLILCSLLPYFRSSPEELVTFDDIFSNEDVSDFDRVQRLQMLKRQKRREFLFSVIVCFWIFCLTLSRTVFVVFSVGNTGLDPFLIMYKVAIYIAVCHVTGIR